VRQLRLKTELVHMCFMQNVHMHTMHKLCTHMAKANILCTLFLDEGVGLVVHFSLEDVAKINTP
jgi:hypothetical protein